MPQNGERHMIPAMRRAILALAFVATALTAGVWELPVLHPARGRAVRR